MSHLIFCDEFGNTGPHLFDSHQPLFAYGFLIVPVRILSTLEASLRRLYQNEGLNLSKLKSSQLWASSRGKHRYSLIGELLAGSDAHLCVSIVEKRYQACVMISETYLDPAYNDCAPPEICIPKSAQKFADASYNWLDDGCLKEFLQAVHDDNPQMIVDVGRKISTLLRQHPEEFVRSAAVCMDTRADRVFRYSQRRPDLPVNSHLPASQYVAFQPALERLDAALQARDATAVLVRDTDSQFGHLLDVAFSVSQRLDEIPEARAYGARRQFTQIRDCRVASSDEELGLQFADLAAGVVGRVARSALTHGRVEKSSLAILRSWRRLLVPREVHYWICSDARMPSVVSALFDEGDEYYEERAL